ncbi:hypothetical protein PG988_001738 [Apiospora saccharicola]
MGPPERVDHPWLSYEAPLSHQTGLPSPPSHHSAFRVPDRSLLDVHQKRAHSKSLMDQGRFGEAVEKLNEGFSGLQQLLTPTHEHTVDTAYLLTEALRRVHRVEEADSVLNWLGAQIARRLGLHSSHTVKHFIRVVDILRAWLRNEAADLMVWRLADILEDEDSGVDDIPIICGTGDGTNLTRDLGEFDVEALFSPPRDVTQRSKL